MIRPRWQMICLTKIFLSIKISITIFKDLKHQCWKSFTVNIVSATPMLVLLPRPWQHTMFCLQNNMKCFWKKSTTKKHTMHPTRVIQSHKVKVIDEVVLKCSTRQICKPNVITVSVIDHSYMQGYSLLTDGRTGRQTVLKLT